MVCLTPGRLANMRPETAVKAQNTRLKTINTGKTLKLKKYFHSNFRGPSGTTSSPGCGMVNIPKMLSAMSTMAIVDTIVQVYMSAFPFCAAATVN